MHKGTDIEREIREAVAQVSEPQHYCQTLRAMHDTYVWRDQDTIVVGCPLCGYVECTQQALKPDTWTRD